MTEQKTKIFDGKTCLIATKHQKEQVLSPPLEQILGMKTKVAEIDTDQFGTFSGEIERKHTPIICSKEKCLYVLGNSQNAHCAIASEGTFGPHPAMPFVNCDYEILYFCDRESDLGIHISDFFGDTNLSGGPFKQLDEFLTVAEKWRFPSHGLILKPNTRQDTGLLFKGIDTLSCLTDAFNRCKSASEDRTVWIETDMRAHKNPTRMKAIGLLAEKLCQRLTSLCPACKYPGWGVVGTSGELYCSLCQAPTKLPSRYELGCVKCPHREALPINDPDEADPKSCPYCNP